MSGGTASERYLARLCRRSFLRLWSWPNVYRDQMAGTTTGKELCDLLVVFDNHVFIFSDKHCEFPNTGNLNQDWIRWFKKAIQQSAKQISGAERWLRSFPNRLFLDKYCKEPFPVGLPPIEQAIFHRIVVAHGSSQRCQQMFQGGTGSLVINPSLIGREHFDPQCPAFAPFTIGRLTETHGFIHVIDDFSLDALLRTLDTAPDLARYLQLRANFIESGQLRFATGEEDLLAYYLRHTNENGEHHFHVPANQDAIEIDERSWQNFRQHPRYLAKLEADQVSYIWDRLIDQFTKHLLDGTQYHNPEHQMADPSVKNQERGLRFLAREGRVRRRMLAKALLGAMEHGNKHGRMMRLVQSNNATDPYYVFLSMQRPPDRSDEEYRRGRARLLRAYCLSTRLKFPKAHNVVGIATEPLHSPEGRSEDMCVIDGAVWDEELAAEAEILQRQYGLFTKITQREFHEPEYPQLSPPQRLKGRNKNKPCPCGSGNKYKKCCGA